MKHAAKALVVAAAVALTLTGCSGTSGEGETEGEVSTIKIGATPTPHGEILAHVQETQAEAAGLNLEVTEFNDYVQPNSALADGSLDANFFQHQPYLDEAVNQNGYDLVSIRAIHVEPLGTYSNDLSSLDELPEGGTVAIPNDPTNEARALRLLVDHGVIELDDPENLNATPENITSNPKNLEFQELEAAQVARALADVDVAIANSNFALDQGLSPREDSIAVEETEDNPYANVLAVRAEDKDDEAVNKLADLLCSAETQKFIEEEYDGSVLPAC